MGHVGRDQDQILRIVAADMIANEPPAAAIEGQRQFVDGMVVPFKGNGGNLPVIDANGTAPGEGHMFELAFHFCVLRQFRTA